MKRKWILGIIAIIISASLMIGGILVSEYCSDGIHFLARNVHIQLAQECFLIHDGKVAGTTAIAMDGYSRGRYFIGYLCVDAYPIPMHEAMMRNAGSNKGGFPCHKDGNYVDISYDGIRNVNSETPSSQYQYLLTLNRDEPERFFIYIYTDEYRQGVAAAVPAASPEEALEIFQAHTAARYGS